MRVLTLTEPWASLVSLGEKQVETRSWQSPYRGTLLIHAAKKMTRDDLAACFEEPFASALKFHNIDPSYGKDVFALGSIIGIANVSRIEQMGTVHFEQMMVQRCAESPHPESTRQVEEAFGDYSDGRYAWLLTGARRLSYPVSAKGMLGLWRLPLELEREVRMASAPPPQPV